MESIRGGQNIWKDKIVQRQEIIMRSRWSKYYYICHNVDSIPEKIGFFPVLNDRITVPKSIREDEVAFTIFVFARHVGFF